MAVSPVPLTATPATVPGVFSFCLHCAGELSKSGRYHAGGAVECDPAAVAFLRVILAELRADLDALEPRAEDVLPRGYRAVTL